jgi:hypothetical protein
MSNFVVKSSINPKSMGDPLKLAVNLAHDGEKALLGTIIGIAQGTVKRNDQKTGMPYFGLAGAFTAIPADTEREEVRSVICYLPDAVHAAIVATLERAHQKDPTAHVRFAMEAAVVKGGTAGFTWEYKPIFEGGVGVMVDPLADIRKAIAGGAKALPAQTDAEKEAMATQATQQTRSRFDADAPQQQAATAPAKGHARK